MKFLIITNVSHTKIADQYLAYAPYVQEMNLWLKHVDEVEVVAHLHKRQITDIDLPYKHKSVRFTNIPTIQFTSLGKSFASLLSLPIILFTLFKACKRADHIHLRCPGNIGLLGCIVQILFRKKTKTAKYAGNWDPNSKQPLSYRLQKRILRNTFFTKNMTALVYGSWKDRTKNIKPFFTASYDESEKTEVDNKPLNNRIKLLFVGTLSKGKQPLISVKATEALINKGYNVELNLYGEGSEKETLMSYIGENSLEEKVILSGNKDKETIKNAYKSSHFLVFISKSEGWPKVVAEAMFWKCLPISTAVSCIPEMLDNGGRGSIVSANIDEIVSDIENYINDESLYQDKIDKAFHWSRNYTLDKFEEEIKDLL